MDKFLLAENPLRPEQSGIWIVHMLDPIAIIKCTEFKIDTGEAINRHYQFRNADGIIEEWTLSVYFTTDFLEKPEDRVPKLLDKAWRWLRAYFEQEDKNIDDEQSPSMAN